MSKTTKKQQIINWFLKHPLATPRVVSEKFNAAMPTVYTLRKQAMHEYQERNAAEMLGPQIDEPQVVVEQADDLQIGGDHYKNMGVQPWKAMEAWMTPEQFAGFLRGNAIKYLARCDAKGGLDDVKKAKHYIDKLIEVRGEDA